MSESMSILSKLSQTRGEEDFEDDVYDESGEYRAFGYSRKPRANEPMIDFIDAQGRHQSFAYGHLYRTEFDPSVGITLEFTNHTVTIQGQRLRQAYGKLTLQRVIFVAEADRPTALVVENESPVVSRLSIAAKRLN